MKYDPDKLTGLISEMKNALKLLKEIAAIDHDTFMNDPHLLSSAKYNLVVAIEATLDICNHLISKNSYRVPEDYADTFRVMSEEGILPKDMVEKKLLKMARFRNRLVHLYWKVDNEAISGIISGHLPDFEMFLHKLKDALDR